MGGFTRCVVDLTFCLPGEWSVGGKNGRGQLQYKNETGRGPWEGEKGKFGILWSTVKRTF
jgi:hypothetical protein